MAEVIAQLLASAFRFAFVYRQLAIRAVEVVFRRPALYQLGKSFRQLAQAL